ncbi:MAG: DUF5710 domain-containing protein [Methylococcales bacterium]|nr:DUF5710 domain-containing protein [Methylococcales bacterium]MDD5632520.1 DUF5710 domain-containing protein [Methylococcales bacterium]
MADSKTYLKVPFAQKDEAKALGARWDAANKKWFVPADKDITLFTRWQPRSDSLESTGTTTITTGKPRPQTAPTKTSAPGNNASLGVMTYAADKDFVAYNDNEAPWD